MRYQTVLWTGLALAGCTEEVCTQERVPIVEVVPSAQGSIGVADALSFDSVEVGVDPPSAAVLLVDNLGDEVLALYDLWLSGEAPDSFLIGRLPAEQLVVDPGEQAELLLEFDPALPEVSRAQLSIHSSDPQQPVVGISLTGRAFAPHIHVSPVELGTRPLGCAYTEQVLIRNLGNTDLRVEGIELLSESSEVALVEPDHLPLSVDAGASVRVRLEYTPLDAYDDEAILVLDSTDPWTPELWVPVVGRGQPSLEVTESWTVRSEVPPDILFTLDRSGSMSDDNAQVIANISTFIHTLTTLEVDYQVGVAVEDDGCFLGPRGYITSSFSATDAATAFADMADISFILGSYGANTERGFSLAEAALSSANIGSGGCNEGFLREEASLSLVHISDEPEQSVNPYTYYVSLFQSMKTNPGDLSIHAVAGDYPGGCGSASPGTGYYEASYVTGGLFLSICGSDWGSDLQRIARSTIIDPTTFYLSVEPVPETLQVLEDGLHMPCGWGWDPATNAVVFEEDYAPAEGSELMISYQPQPVCD